MKTLGDQPGHGLCPPKREPLTVSGSGSAAQARGTTGEPQRGPAPCAADALPKRISYVRVQATLGG